MLDKKSGMILDESSLYKPSPTVSIAVISTQISSTRFFTRIESHEASNHGVKRSEEWLIRPNRNETRLKFILWLASGSLNIAFYWISSVGVELNALSHWDLLSLYW